MENYISSTRAYNYHNPSKNKAKTATAIWRAKSSTSKTDSIASDESLVPYSDMFDFIQCGSFYDFLKRLEHSWVLKRFEYRLSRQRSFILSLIQALAIVLCLLPLQAHSQTPGNYYWADRGNMPTFKFHSPDAVCAERNKRVGSNYQLHYEARTEEAGWCVDANPNVGTMGSAEKIQCSSTQISFDDAFGCIGVDPYQPKFDGDKGNGKPCPYCGNPINPATGNKYQLETDYVDSTPFGKLTISRSYNSAPTSLGLSTAHSLGYRWLFDYDATVKKEPDSLAYAWQPSTTQCWVRWDTGQIWCFAQDVTDHDTMGVVSMLWPNGRRIIATPGQTYVTGLDIQDKLTANKDALGNIVGWQQYVAEDDSVKTFDANGRLLNIVERNGGTRTLTYSDGTTNDTHIGRSPTNAPACSHQQLGAALPASRLLCVTDSWGRQLQFEYDSQGRISTIFDPAGQAYLYAYDGPSGGCTAANATSLSCTLGRLTSVTYPDGKTKTYYYNELALINNGSLCPESTAQAPGFGNFPGMLTGIVDENGTRFASWAYDCKGNAVASQHAGGVEKVNLTYGNVDSTGERMVTVTHTSGEASNPQITTNGYQFQRIFDVMKNIGMDHPCVECGPINSRTYDGNGNVASSTDWNGIVTTYGYDLSRNLETSRVEASGTPQARTVMTSWHPSYRLSLSTSEPLLRTTYTYDGSGNVLTKTEQATTDANGAAGFGATLTGSPRTWTYTYNNLGQVLTATGPRTDVTDVTTYTYEGSGNLSTVTNALGHVTSLTNYDANGRVGHITEPNGATTDLAYSPRGWLTSRIVTSGTTVESTSYDYDGVGQVKLVTLPDRSSVSYAYDDAHRLTQVSDSLGNSITYTLDLRGNRTQEQVKDPNGNLARQISRVYDSLNRLQQVTGAAQ